MQPNCNESAGFLLTTIGFTMAATSAVFLVLVRGCTGADEKEDKSIRTKHAARFTCHAATYEGVLLMALGAVEIPAATMCLADSLPLVSSCHRTLGYVLLSVFVTFFVVGSLLTLLAYFVTT